jgi:hypothetical protein
MNTTRDATTPYSRADIHNRRSYLRASVAACRVTLPCSFACRNRCARRIAAFSVVSARIASSASVFAPGSCRIHSATVQQRAELYLHAPCRPRVAFDFLSRPRIAARASVEFQISSSSSRVTYVPVDVFGPPDTARRSPCHFDVDSTRTRPRGVEFCTHPSCSVPESPRRVPELFQGRFRVASIPSIVLRHSQLCSHPSNSRYNSSIPRRRRPSAFRVSSCPDASVSPRVATAPSRASPAQYTTFAIFRDVHGRRITPESFQSNPQSICTAQSVCIAAPVARVDLQHLRVKSLRT